MSWRGHGTEVGYCHLLDCQRLEYECCLTCCAQFLSQIIKQDCSYSILVECKTEERDIHLTLLSFLVNFTTELSPGFSACVPLWFFLNKNLTVWTYTWESQQSENLSTVELLNVEANWTWEGKEGNRQTDNASLENKILFRSKWFISQDNHDEVKYLSHYIATFFRSSQPWTQRGGEGGGVDAVRWPAVKNLS